MKKNTIKQFVTTGILFALTSLFTIASVWAQNYTDVASAKNAIKNASLNSVIKIDNVEWYVVKKYPASNPNFAMLVSRRAVQAIGPIPFNPITNHNNNYEGSNLQSRITAFCSSPSLSVIRQIAIQPVIGSVSDNKSTSFVTNPKLPMAPAGGQTKDILFALTYRDAANWNFMFNTSYYFRWWTRTGNSGVPTYAYEVNIPGGTINGTADVSSTGTIDVVVGVWVSYGTQQYSISGQLIGGNVANETITYKIGSGANQIVRTDASGNYVISGIDEGSVVLIAPPYQQGYTVSPKNITTPPITNNLTNQDFTYFISFSPRCMDEGTLLYKEDFGGNNVSDPWAHPTGLPPEYSSLPYSIVSRPNGGYYSLVKNPYRLWQQEFRNISDHTFPNDTTRGYMMFIDPAATDGNKMLYQTEINNLCDNMILSFSAWFIDVNNHKFPTATSPRIEMQVIDKAIGTVLKTSGVIILPKVTDWQQYGLNFTLPAGVTDVIFKILNRENSTQGNDWAMDDIEIRFCAPPVIVPFNDLTECEGTSTMLEGSYSDDGTFGNELSHYWEYSSTGNINNPAGWSIISDSKGSVTSGIVSSFYTIPSLTSSHAGYYRLVVSASSTGNPCRMMSKIVKLTVNNCAIPETTVMGTVFPFVHWNMEEFDSLFPITVNLKLVPNPRSGDPLRDLKIGPSLYSTEATYYDGSVFVPYSPKSPGMVGALNNYGLLVNWIDAIYVQGSDPVTNILEENGIPVTINGSTLGLYKIEHVKKGDYILEIKREGFVTRWAKIKVDADAEVEYFGHRELVAGDIDDNYTVNVTDVALEKLQIGGNYVAPHTHYESKYDLNADGQVNLLDFNLILKFTGFWFYHYQETKEWLDALKIRY
jgi:hypothetical protein